MLFFFAKLAHKHLADMDLMRCGKRTLQRPTEVVVNTHKMAETWVRSGK